MPATSNQIIPKSILEGDVSVTLDLLRACAAQMVCLGHIWNLWKFGHPTTIPHLGVSLFFVLSGFVIAYTLTSKSAADERYGPWQFIVERAARILTAYIPAVALIAVLDFTALASGLPLGGGDRSLSTFVRNLVMYPFGPGSFGSGGHLNSVVIEFHIYLFIGGVFFLVLRRNVLLSAALAIFMSAIPLAYFNPQPGTDKSLFVLWLLGFGAFFVAGVVRSDRMSAFISGAIAVALAVLYFFKKSDEIFDLKDFPFLIASFTALVICARGGNFWKAHPLAAKIVRMFAAGSFSLYLTHYTFQQIAALIWPGSIVAAIAMALFCNAFALLFAYVFERHYKLVAHFVLDKVKLPALA